MSAEDAAEQALSRNGSLGRLQGGVGAVPLELGVQTQSQPAGPKTVQEKPPAEPEGDGQSSLQLGKSLNQHDEPRK